MITIYQGQLSLCSCNSWVTMSTKLSSLWWEERSWRYRRSIATTSSVTSTTPCLASQVTQSRRLSSKDYMSLRNSSKYATEVRQNMPPKYDKICHQSTSLRQSCVMMKNWVMTSRASGRPSLIAFLSYLFGDDLHSPRVNISLSSSFSLCQGWGAACNFFTASSAILLHPPLSPVFFFQSPSYPVFFTSLLTQSSHLSIGLPRLLLPCSRNSAALFGSLS